MHAYSQSLFPIKNSYLFVFLSLEVVQMNPKMCTCFAFIILIVKLGAFSSLKLSLLKLITKSATSIPLHLHNKLRCRLVVHRVAITHSRSDTGNVMKPLLHVDDS